MTRKRILIVIIILILAAAGVYAYKNTNEETDKLITASGNIEATEVDISLEVPGRLIEVNAEEGQTVKVGDILAKIDSTTYDLQVKQQEALLQSSQARASETKSGTRQEMIEQAKANVKQAGAMVDASRTSMDNTEDNYKRIKALFESGGATKQQLDNVETQMQSARAQFEAHKANLDAAREQLNLLQNGSTTDAINMANAGVAQAQAAVELAKAQKLKTIITAPTEAVVSTVAAQKGEFMGAGANIITLIDYTDLWLKVYIAETEIPLVKVGQKAQIYIDAFPKKAFEGEVVFISPKAEFTPKNLQTKKERVKTVFGVKIKITSGKESLKPGLPADVKIEL